MIGIPTQLPWSRRVTWWRRFSRWPLVERLDPQRIEPLDEPPRDAAGMRVIQVPDVKAPSAEVLAFGHPVYPSLQQAHAQLQAWQGLPR